MIGGSIGVMILEAILSALAAQGTVTAAAGSARGLSILKTLVTGRGTLGTAREAVHLIRKLHDLVEEMTGELRGSEGDQPEERRSLREKLLSRADETRRSAGVWFQERKPHRFSGSRAEND